MPNLHLSQLKTGERARIIRVNGQGRLRQRFMDMGLIKNTEIEITAYAPLGDPINVNVRGYHLAIRRHEADLIEVERLDPPPPSETQPGARIYEFSLPVLRNVSHPVVINPNPCSTPTLLLAGNPNCGKSTLFNLLTGSHQHVGNWPGKTVEKKDGLWIENNRVIQVVDLPGTYSLTAYSLEEIIARDAILDCGANMVVIVVDAANLERNLYLVVQILEMSVRAVLVLNMWDVATSEGIEIDTDILSQRLGIPVVVTALNTGVGLDALKTTLIKALEPVEVV